MSALVALSGALAFAGCGRRDACDDAYRAEDWDRAVSACRQAYQRGRRPGDGIRLALASSFRDDRETAAAVAAELTAGPEAARAHRLLAESRRNDDALGAAATHATTALVLHAVLGADRELARDAHALAGVLTAVGGYQAALTAVDLARDASIRSRDRRMQGYSELGRGDLFRLLGDRRSAERALDVAAGLLAPSCDRGWVLLKQGRLYMAEGQTTLARQALADALATTAACPREELTSAVHINLAWLALDRGDRDEAEAEVAAVTLDSIDIAVIRGLIQVEAGDIDGAAATLDAASRLTSPDAAWAWLTPHLLAEVEELRGHDAAAEAAYRRAIAAVAAVRAGSPSHAAYVAASHRRPTEGLFGLLARHRRWREALALVVALDASDMLRITAVAGGLGAGGVAEPAGAALQPVAIAGGGDRELGLDVDAVLAAWSGRELSVVLAPSPRLVRAGADRARVWRLRIAGGAIEGSEWGAAADAEALAERLLGDPDDRVAAAALGAILVPATVAGTATAGAPIHVLPIGRVARAPLAALRHGEALVVARHPLIRVLGLRPRPRPPARSGAVVIGDPRRDLVAAADEARWVGRALAAPAHLGADASLARLASAAGAAVLHVAAHADERAGRRVLHLADGDLLPARVVASRIGPGLVVLASCGSAAARDEGGWGSLAAAFVTAGSDHVVATAWSVDDVASADLIRRFYAAGGAEAPAAALAAAQVALSTAAPASTWAAFTVIGAPPSAPLPALR